MTLAFDQPYWLLLAPLALVPVLVRSERPLAYPGLDLIPNDAVSTTISVLARVLGAALVLSLIVALAGPHRPARTEQRVGRGAEVVLLLDRSASMDQSFAAQHLNRSLTLGNLRTKGDMANALLRDFVASRANDLVGMVVFSTAPLQTLPLSRQPALMQAAIRAAGIGRGLARTQVGAGLEHALSLFEGRPYRGSRIVMLISDGAARLGAAAQTRIRNAARRNRVTLYWLYLRSRGSPGIDDTGARPATPTDNPEQALHRFFARIGIPYRFYDAEDPGALQAAIDDVNHQQKLPIHYQEQVPRVELSASFYWLALGLAMPLVALRAAETRTWR